MRGIVLQVLCALFSFADDAAPIACPQGATLVHEPYASGCQITDTRGKAMRHGPWIVRDDAGRQRQSGGFAYGRPNGIWTYWYRDGSKQEERPYLNGKLHGLRRRWDARGKSDGMECFIDNERRRFEACNQVKFAYDPLHPETPARRAPASAKR